MKKAKRKKSKTTKAIRSAKSAARKTGAGTQAGRKEGSPRYWPGLNASEQTLNRILSYSVAPRQLPKPDARCSDRGAA